MSTVKKIALIAGSVVALLIVLPLVIALFVNKDYAVESDVLINRPSAEVFEYVKYLKNQDNYSVWAAMDPDMKQEFTGTDGTAGFVAAWEGNSDVGKGQQTIVSISEGERIDYTIHFIEPWEGHANAYIITEAIGENQTRVVWGFSSRMAYPLNIMLLFMNMEEMIGSDLQNGLNNLKALLEESGQTAEFDE